MAASSTTAVDVNFLYKAMVERDPQKRRVKPVERHMLQLDFGDLDDSSDDSDFKVTDGDEQPDGDDDSDSSASNDNKDESDESGNDAEDGGVDSMTDGSRSDASYKERKMTVSLAELIEQARLKQAQARQRIASAETKGDLLKVLICAVCLGDISEENDEIVECDGCGVSVHEGCYGISDTETVDSTVSSCSTEPWFCESCRSGNMQPTCELCPNVGGIFKETEVGKWVHLVCALYIPGVAFGDVDKLSPVTLFEMPYSKWGARACMLCEDERFSLTGVCICCDAGMCRHYFHATCAQREGLLSEASQEEVREIADPFFAHCKLHADKMIVRQKRRNWLALQSQVKQRKEMSTRNTEEQDRIARKLEAYHVKYFETKGIKSQPWVPTQKMPRLLTSSPSACRKLIRKTELMGINAQVRGLATFESLVNIRRKWHIPPAFSVEFVSYYLDRNARMLNMQSRLDELLMQNGQLQDEERNIRKTYDELFSENEKFMSTNTVLREQGLSLWKTLDSLGGKKHVIPEIFRVKKVVKSPAKHGKKADSDHNSVALNKCGLCKRTSNQHLLAKCDTCRLFYHLGCLDPPLSRMPKKTKLQGWQCSECDKTEEEANDDDVDPNAPRKLRKHIKEPVKFTRSLGGGTNGSGPASPVEFESIGQKSRRTRRRMYAAKKVTKSQLQVKTLVKTSEVKENPEIEPKKRKMLAKEQLPVVEKNKPKDTSAVIPAKKRKRSNSSTSGSQKSTKTPKKCHRCDTSGDNRTLVRCDECCKCYHFRCLKPPLKKSPKQRGYDWHCEDCDSTDDENEVKDVNCEIVGIKALKIVLEKKSLEDRVKLPQVKVKRKRTVKPRRLVRRTRKKVAKN